ncbi:L-methionine gamma-lyase-like [Liolophura sinensis]|uniref:L-methionine gamma-lyase-like n=1 Tax=Liolophura sinensis TaxID=3198878 RepID=UPI0031594801
MGDYWHPSKSVLESGVLDLSLDDVALETRPILARSDKPVAGVMKTQPLVPPIYHASTYVLKSVEEYCDVVTQGGHIYSRLGNFTTDSAECAINAVEGGAGSLLFSSGMAAVSTAIMGCVSAGDHVVAPTPLYSGTFELFKSILPRFNIEISYVESGSSVEEYKKLVKSNTKLLYTETPCNPDMSLTDIKAFAELGKSLGITTIVDGTFASPYIQRSLQLGVDISMHSCTKYVGGHSDLIAGCLTMRTPELWKKLRHFQMLMGCILSPHDASLLLRGVRTLGIRMEKHSANAMKIAEFLEKHPKIERVMYPGLPSHPQHELAKSQMKGGFGGMMSFDVKGGKNAGITLVENVRVINLAVSLGGVQSLIEHTASMTHGPLFVSDEDRRAQRIGDGHIRFSVGIENADDLIRDLSQALEKISI